VYQTIQFIPHFGEYGGFFKIEKWKMLVLKAM